MESVAGAEPPATVADDEWLLRLNFSPEHIVGGGIVPSAISLTDLKTRGYSVDREHLLELGVMQDRAAAQQAKAPESREQPFLSKFECGPVRQEKDGEGETAFTVNASPRDDNKAHAHILSAIHRGDGALRKIRTLLIPHLQRLVSFDEYLKPRLQEQAGEADPA